MYIYEYELLRNWWLKCTLSLLWPFLSYIDTCLALELQQDLLSALSTYSRSKDKTESEVFF